MFTGVSAFPLTPLAAGEVDETAFIALIGQLVEAGVHSIGALGSTGSYAYLTRQQRQRVTQLAVSAAAGIPVMTSIGSLQIAEILALAEDAQQAGVSGLLLAPLSYQRLTADEVYDLYERVTRELSVPLCVYDNPSTTGFTFSDELLAAVCLLPQIGSVKLSPLSTDPDAARQRIATIRQLVPQGVTVGISGDAQAVAGLLGGCDVWYSVLAGLFPRHALRLLQSAKHSPQEALRLNERLSPLWAIWLRYGSVRVIATAAELSGQVQRPALPFPLKTLPDAEREQLRKVLETLALLA